MTTSAGNVPDVVSLVNKDRYYSEATYLWASTSSPGSGWQNDTAPENWSAGITIAVNLARFAQAGIVGLTDMTVNAGVEVAALAVGKSRYSIHIAETSSNNPIGRYLRYCVRM